MSRTRDSRQTVIRCIASRRHADWPVYDSTPLYSQSSLGGLESDIQTVSQTWFGPDRHKSVEDFICSLPLAYFNFDAYDRYVGPIRYEMDSVSRVRFERVPRLGA